MSRFQYRNGNKKRLKSYTYLGCPLTRNNTPWCFGLCTPDKRGRGRCGRIAPHKLRSRIQLAIEEYNRKQLLNPDSAKDHRECAVSY